MRAEPVLHPTDETLAAYGLGKVNDATAASVLQHLETCPECRKRVAELPPDSFLGRLQCVGVGDRTPEPPRPLTGLAGTVSRTVGETARAESEPEPVPPALARNPDYQVVRKLGAGGMGVVYLVRNVLMDRFEVLKVMNRDSVNRPGAVERFLREIRAAAQLSHPNVVRAYAAARADDVLTFAMEFVDGDDLARVVEKGGPLPVARACYYVRQAALGLQHAHEHGMVHRDIKPANLILARVGNRHTVKILDFGLAKATSEAAADTALTGADQIMGTPLYMSPEQARSAARADIRADIYSLGCTLYHLLTGRPPFVAQSVFDVLLSHREDTARPLNGVRADVPLELSMAVEKMLAKDPAHRFQTPGEVAAALAPFVKPGSEKPADGTHPLPPAEPVPPEPAGREVVSAFWDAGTQADATRLQIGRAPARRRWLWAVAVGAVACGLAAVLAGGALRVKTEHGTVVLDNVPAGADVEVDGERVTLTRNGEVVTVSAVKGGPHRLKVVQGGREVWSSDVTVKVGGESVRMSVEARPAKPDPAKSEPAKSAPPPIPPAEPAKAKEEFVSLFDGTTLTGLKLAGPKTTLLSITGGDLLARNTGPQGYVDHLITDRTDYADGRFRCQFRLSDATAVAHVMFRIDPSPVVFGGMRGYAVTVQGTKPGSDGKSGRAALALASRVRPAFQLAQADCDPLAAEEWHALELVAAGPRLTVLVNGKRVLDHTDEGPVFACGALALMFRPGDDIRYRKIEYAPTAVAPPDPPADPRARWVHQAVVGNEFNERWVAFQHAGGKKWVRASTDHPRGFEREEYTEVERTKEYIELEQSATRSVVRVYEEHTEAGPTRAALRKEHTGAWVK